ncbi:MAG TPA: XRE family transcriptional regulator [Candidatus Brachybacterium merdigallinarum]|nr:XRE family transcriptional regulator [Candidatus Brachybacterium merdigallinarum]
MSGGMRPAVVEQLGARIRAARQELDLSVAALAERSDISRRMLTQIELGQANPSVAILDRVAAGLGTTFAALMGVGADSPPDGVEVWSTEAGSWSVLLDAIDAAGVSIETWKWKLVGTDAYEGASGIASPGHMVHVVEGALEIVIGQEVRTIAAGGSARVMASGGYRYRAADEQGAVYFVVAPQLPPPPRG